MSLGKFRTTIIREKENTLGLNTNEWVEVKKGLDQGMKRQRISSGILLVGLLLNLVPSNSQAFEIVRLSIFLLVIGLITYEYFFNPKTKATNKLVMGLYESYNSSLNK